MKKLMGILLAASMVFSLAACGSTADTAASSAAGNTTATAEGSSNNQAPDVKVGAIILGDETEGYSAAHINGIKELPPSWACPMTRSSGSTRSLRAASPPTQPRTLSARAAT